MEKLKEILDKIKEQWSKISKRDKIILGISFLVIPLFIYFKFYFYPTLNTIKKLKQERKNLQSKLISSQQKQAILMNIKKQIQEKNLILKKVERVLPTRKEIPELLNSISEEATKAGLTITYFRPKKEEKTDYYAIIPIEIEVIGSFHQIIFFIDSLRKLERIVNTKKISLTKYSQSKKEIILKANCILEIYRFLTEKERYELQQAKKKRKKK